VSQQRNWAEYYRLQGQLTSVNSQIVTLSATRANLVTYLRSINTAHDSLKTTRTSVYGNSLTKSIQVTNQFEGKCAESLKSSYASATNLIATKEASINTLRTAVNTQITRIDTKVTQLQEQARSISWNMWSV
jgi:prefoldin subunit 5